jgi:hypothetical protein
MGIRSSPEPVRLALAAALVLGTLAMPGCQRSQAAVAAPALALQGEAIDSPATGPSSAPMGYRQAPNDPTARAKMLVEAPRPLARQGYAPITFADLSGFLYDTDRDGKLTPGSRLPEQVKKLDKTRVALSGYMVPIEFKGDKVSSMILVRNQLLCCFGQNPKLNEWAFVNIDPPVDSTMDVPVTLYGILHASPDVDDGEVISLYRMDAQTMEAMEAP